MEAAKGPLIKVSFEESIKDYEPAPVCLKVRAKAAGSRISYLPEIDTSQPLNFTATSIAEPGRDVKDYLRFTETEVLPNSVVRFYVEPSRNLQRSPNFNRIINREFVVTVKAKLKPDKNVTRRELSGQFRVKIESRVKIHWKWESHPFGFPEQSGEDVPIVLQPDAKSWFKLTVWTTEWHPKEQKLVPSDPKSYEFSHWIAPDHPDMNYNIFAPDPLPWKVPKRNAQAENIWLSKADLPDLERLPSLNQLPVETSIRVKAWHRNSIEERLENAVKANQPEAGEVEIPVRLIKAYLLSIAVFLERDDKPLRTYEERVNGEKVQIYCPNLASDIKAKIRWSVTGPKHYLGGKRKFQTNKETELVPGIAPAGKECLKSEIEIAQPSCSSANPPVFLDVEVNFKVVLLTPKLPIVLDGKEVLLTFGVYHQRSRRPAKNIDIFWQLISQPGKTHGNLHPSHGRTNDKGELEIQYIHEIRSSIEKRDKSVQALDEEQKNLQDLKKWLKDAESDLRDSEHYKTLLENPNMDWDTVFKLYQQRSVPRRTVPDSGRNPTARWWTDLDPNKDIANPYWDGVRPPSMTTGPAEAEAYRHKLIEESRDTIEALKEDIRIKFPRLISQKQRELKELEARIRESEETISKREEVRFFRDRSFQKLINPVNLLLTIPPKKKPPAVERPPEPVMELPKRPPKSETPERPVRPSWRKPLE